MKIEKFRIDPDSKKKTGIVFLIMVMQQLDFNIYEIIEESWEFLAHNSKRM